MTNIMEQPPSLFARRLLLGLHGLFWLMLALCTVYLMARWNDIPTRYPIHWGIDGQPDGWSHKTFFGVFWPIGLAALVGAMLLVVGRLGIPRGKTGIEAALTLIAFIVGLPLAGTAVYLPFRASTGMPGAFIALVVILVVAVNPLIIVLMTSSLPRPNPRSPRNDSRFWKWGLYNNPDDPAIIVEKPSGLGWTFNIAQPQGRLIVVVLLAVPVAVLAIVLGTIFLNR